MRLRTASFLLALALVPGCSKPSGAPAPDAAAAPPTASVAAKPAPAPAPRADGPASKSARTALTDGRANARKKEWATAQKIFAAGLEAVPNDATLLAELTWAAFNAKDLDAAEAAAKHGLAVVKEPLLRAQLLYSAARVKEARSDKGAARAMYTESLGLRENAEVRRRLDALGGPSGPFLPCQAGANDVEAVCACLGKHADDLFVTGDDLTCKTMPVSLSLGTPRLSVVSYGPKEGILGRTVYLLVARDAGKARPLAELGADFEPGAFGVHNASTVHGGDVKTIGAREVVVVKSSIDDNDMNLAGLEQCFDHAEVETVCALAESIRCVSVRVKEESGCGPGVEPEEDDEEAKALIKERKASWATTKTTRRWSLTPSGALQVAGDDAGTAPSVFPLFGP